MKELAKKFIDKECLISVLEYEQQELTSKAFANEEYEYPTHHTAMTYTLEPELPNRNFQVRDVLNNDEPKRRPRNGYEPKATYDACSIGIIGGADGPTAFIFSQGDKKRVAKHAALSALHFKPTNNVEWKIYLLVFFALGFLIYAFLFGAVGSTASKLEDINTSVLPVTFMFIIAFFVVMFSMTSGSVDSVLMKGCSYIPFTLPMAMFTRICMSTVPLYEILISIAILIASVVGVGVIAAKIYRTGVLMYGTQPKLGNIIKAVWKA